MSKLFPVVVNRETVLHSVFNRPNVVEDALALIHDAEPRAGSVQGVGTFRYNVSSELCRRLGISLISDNLIEAGTARLVSNIVDNACYNLRSVARCSEALGNPVAAVLSWYDNLPEKPNQLFEELCDALAYLDSECEGDDELPDERAALTFITDHHVSYGL